jgi:ribosome biogenesis GTPase
MNLEELGYNQELERFRKDKGLTGLDVGRVVTENRERYSVRTAGQFLVCELLGNLRYTAESRSDLPAVGDWVALSPYDDEHGIIHAIFPRKSILERQAAGKSGDIQIIAANIDVAFIIQSVGRDFNLNRLERYLTICYSHHVEPVIVLTKIDLYDETEMNASLTAIHKRIIHVPVIAVSNVTRKGYEKLFPILSKGKTYCMLGSSGAGKSTLLNNLAGKQIMETKDISMSTGKGKHATSHRELIVLEQGGVMIDNPGLREVGIADTGNGLENTFDEILRYSAQCRFSDCTHTGEKGCAVLEAVKRGEIERSLYDNFIKLTRERARFLTSVAEKRKKEKTFGKIIKEYKKLKKRGEDEGTW